MEITTSLFSCSGSRANFSLLDSNLPKNIQGFSILTGISAFVGKLFGFASSLVVNGKSYVIDNRSFREWRDRNEIKTPATSISNIEAIEGIRTAIISRQQAQFNKTQRDLFNAFTTTILHRSNNETQSTEDLKSRIWMRIFIHLNGDSLNQDGQATQNNVIKTNQHIENYVTALLKKYDKNTANIFNHLEKAFKEPLERALQNDLALRRARDSDRHHRSLQGRLSTVAKVVAVTAPIFFAATALTMGWF